MSFVILCPSVELEGVFATEPCTAAKCSWWKNGGCSARETVLEEYGAHVTTLPVVACPVQFQCRWYLDAIRKGEPSCGVQQLGMICEHQGGEWNTFEMAPANEW